MGGVLGCDKCVGGGGEELLLLRQFGEDVGDVPVVCFAVVDRDGAAGHVHVAEEETSAGQVHGLENQIVAAHCVPHYGGSEERHESLLVDGDGCEVADSGPAKINERGRRRNWSVKLNIVGVGVDGVIAEVLIFGQFEINCDR